MTRRATFTAAELRRAMAAAQKIDPRAVVEVANGAIRIMQGAAAPVVSPPDDESDEENTCDGKFGRQR